jgi:NAD(P)H-dependent FMN reductase
MTTYKVGYFVGSLATASINRLLAKALVRLAPPELKFVEIPIKDLPLYSYDYDADFPPVRAPSSRRSPKPTACSSSRPSTTARSPAS